MAKDDDRIIFTGFVQGQLLDELYSNAYIYTLPSDLEGMPLSLLEAMSYGNCCLVSVRTMGNLNNQTWDELWSSPEAEKVRAKVRCCDRDCCSAYVPEHHEAIVSPEIARAAHLVASSRKKCGVQDIVVIQQGTLKGFVGIHPNWSGINAESIRSLCLNAYLPEEVVELNDMTEMRSGKKSDMVLLSDYLTVSGTCFINQSSPVITISKNGIRFSKACHTRLDDCEYVELLYHPILQVVILRKSNHDFSTAMHWREDNDVHSAFSARAFSGLVLSVIRLASRICGLFTPLGIKCVSLP